MGDETWASIQMMKSKRESLREKMKKRKAERENILSSAIVADSAGNFMQPLGSGSPSSSPNLSLSSSSTVAGSGGLSVTAANSSPSSPVLASSFSTTPAAATSVPVQVMASDAKLDDDPYLECKLLEHLIEAVIPLPSANITPVLSSKLGHSVSQSVVRNLLQKFAYKDLISIRQSGRDVNAAVTVTAIEHTKIKAVLEAEHKDKMDAQAVTITVDSEGEKRKLENDGTGPVTKLTKKEDQSGGEAIKESANGEEEDVLSLLSTQSIKERETKKVGEEILELLSKPTAKEQSLAQRFRSQGGAKVQEFCPHGTKEECERVRKGNSTCGKLHFRKIIQKHTDESLGDCSFLNTCFHMDTCRYVHYEVDYSGVIDQQLLQEQVPSQTLQEQVAQPVSAQQTQLQQSLQLKHSLKTAISRPRMDERTILFPPQWIQCDLRFMDMSILGKFAVIMADPPWDIHMELPYGTMSDDEMRRLDIPTIQEEGLIFLWVTGRAMELGRECLTLWGYERVDEIIWVKTNQLQRIIRTGRTGHWLNHGKEHCLVGMKGNPKINRWLDADVIVAEVRATSHKPDEIYGIIERLSPGTRKLELFGRPHNVQPNWLTLGNQLEGVNLLEEDLVKSFKERYPDGNCCKPPAV